MHTCADSRAVVAGRPAITHENTRSKTHTQHGWESAGHNSNRRGWRDDDGGATIRRRQR